MSFATDLDRDPQELRRLGLKADALEDLKRVMLIWRATLPYFTPSWNRHTSDTSQHTHTHIMCIYIYIYTYICIHTYLHWHISRLCFSCGRSQSQRLTFWTCFWSCAGAGLFLLGLAEMLARQYFANYQNLSQVWPKDSEKSALRITVYLKGQNWEGKMCVNPVVPWRFETNQPFTFRCSYHLCKRMDRVITGQ